MHLYLYQVETFQAIFIIFVFSSESRFCVQLMSGSCHLDRASNVKIGVECQTFVIVLF